MTFDLHVHICSLNQIFTFLLLLLLIRHAFWQELHLQSVERVMILVVNCIIKKIAFIVMLTFKYVSIVRFVRDLIIFSWLFSCQCQCFIIDTRILMLNLTKLFFLLVWTFLKSKTRKTSLCVWIQFCDEFISWIFWWIEFSFEFYMFRLHTFELFRVLNYAHLTTSWFFVHWFANLIYFEIWKTLTEFWTTILSLSHYNVFCSLFFADFLRLSFW